MSKRYSAKDMRNMLIHVISVSSEGIQEASKALEKLAITKEEWEEKGDKAREAQVLLSQISIFNYIMAPLFGIARQQFPHLSVFMDACEQNHNRALKDGVYKACECQGCKDGHRDSNKTQ